MKNMREICLEKFLYLAQAVNDTKREISFLKFIYHFFYRKICWTTSVALNKRTAGTMIFSYFKGSKKIHDLYPQQKSFKL